MWGATKLCNSFDTVDIKLLNLKGELSILLLVNNLSGKILLHGVYVFGDSVRILLNIAVCFKPEIIRLAKND